jgi:hypothetical protein
VTSKEALAISTLGVDHITISGAVLEALADDQNAQELLGAQLDVDVSGDGTPVGGKSDWSMLTSSSMLNNSKLHMRRPISWRTKGSLSMQALRLTRA